MCLETIVQITGTHSYRDFGSNGKKWCSTSVTAYDGEYIDEEDDKWGLCSRECEKKEGKLKGWDG